MPETASILIVPSGQEEDHAIPRIRCVTVQNSLPELTRTPSPFESQEIHLHLHGAAPPPRAFMSIRGTDMEELSACRMTLHLDAVCDGRGRQESKTGHGNAAAVQFFIGRCAAIRKDVARRPRRPSSSWPLHQQLDLSALIEGGHQRGDCSQGSSRLLPQAVGDPKVVGSSPTRATGVGDRRPAEASRSHRQRIPVAHKLEV
jgi:hypothetical protein